MRFTLTKLFLAVALLALACGGLFYRTNFWGDAILTLTVAMFVVVILGTIGRQGRERVAGLAFGIIGLAYALLIACSQFQGIRESLLTNYPIAMAAKTLRVFGPLYSPAPAYFPATTYAPPPSAAPVAAAPSPSPPENTPAATPTSPVALSGSQADVVVGESSTAPQISSPTTAPYFPPAVPPPSYFSPSPAFDLSLQVIISSAFSYGTNSWYFFLIGHCVWSWLFAVLGAWFAGRMYDRRKSALTAAS
jgi:hypothetical protein